jgi:hypothetical protein
MGLGQGELPAVRADNLLCVPGLTDSPCSKRLDLIHKVRQHGACDLKPEFSRERRYSPLTIRQP